MKNEPPGEFGQRLKYARKHLKISQIDFADRLSLSNTYLSEIESGKVKPGLDFITRVTGEFKISPLYLLHGAGGMFWSDEPPPATPAKKPNKTTISERKIDHEIDHEIDYDINYEINYNLGDEVKEMLKNMSQVPLLKYVILGYYEKYLIEHQGLIEQYMTKPKKAPARIKRKK